MARPKNTQNIGRYDHTGKTNPSGIMALNEACNTQMQEYKKRALGHRWNRKYTISEISSAIRGMTSYVKESMKTGTPATVAGLILATGYNKDFYYKAKQGNYDYITFEYIDSNNISLSDCFTDQDGLLIYSDERLNDDLILSLCSDAIEKCLLIMENDLQQRSLTDKSMARTTGAIFNLKAVFNYNDKPEAEVKTVNNTLIVNASPEQTSKAMQLLLKDK